MEPKQSAMSASTTWTHPKFSHLAMASEASLALRLGRNPKELGRNWASKIGSMTSRQACCTTRSFTVGTRASYCGSVQVLCGLGFDVARELVGGGDSLQAGGLDVRGEADPKATGGAAAGGDVAAFGPVVDDVGLDAESGGDVGDAALVVGAWGGVDVGVLVGRAGGALLAGVLDLGWERDAPAAGGAAAGVQEAGGDPVVHGPDRHADQLGDLARSEFAVGQQAGKGDVVVVAEVRGRVDVEGASGAGGVPGLVERRSEGGVVQGRADAAGQVDRLRGGAPPLRHRFGALDQQLGGGAGVPLQPDPKPCGVAGGSQGDVADQGAQQAFAVLVAGGR